jgi:hypothetical protein
MSGMLHEIRDKLGSRRGTLTCAKHSRVPMPSPTVRKHEAGTAVASQQQ